MLKAELLKFLAMAPIRRWNRRMSEMNCNGLIRYRTEAFSGSGERDAATVMAFETLELGNTDILETLCDGLLQGAGALFDMCKSLIRELEDNGFIDDMSFDDVVAFYKDVLSEVELRTGHKVQYALWLADKETVTDCRWYGRDMVDDGDYESYIVGPVVLSELGFDGTLYGYTELPVSLEAQIECLKDTLFDVINEREGVPDGTKRAVWLDERYAEIDGEIQELSALCARVPVDELTANAAEKAFGDYNGVSVSKSVEDKLLIDD